MEFFALTGATASIAQILVYLAKTALSVREFCENVENAPGDFRRVLSKILLLQSVLQDLQHQVGNCTDDDTIVPAHLRLVMEQAILQMMESLQAVRSKCEKTDESELKRVGKRIKFVIREKQVISRLLREVNDAEDTLSTIVTCLTTRIMIIWAHGQSSKRNDILAKNPGTAASPPITQKRGAAFGANSVLYSFLGFSGFVAWKSGHDGSLLDACLSVGYKFPPSLYAKVIDAEFKISRINSRTFSFMHLPRVFRVQNQVPADSPIMVASRDGDVVRITQLLRERPEAVSDRTLCSGKTPLLLAVEGGHVAAVEVLLNNKADPNVGDDDRLLPVFCAASKILKKHSLVLDLPRHNPSWFEITRLLVAHGASVHEVVDGRSLTTLNIVSDFIKPMTLEFFHLLKSQFYQDFDVAGAAGWSALVAALRSRDQTVPALGFLSENGVSLSRILPDGRTALHLASELVVDEVALAYVCDSCDAAYINRQDHAGWTPLHYALLPEFYGTTKRQFAKVRLLLERGADPCIKAAGNPLLYIHPTLDQFDCFEQCRALSSDFCNSFVDTVRLAGKQLPPGWEEEIFFDAAENLSAVSSG